MNQTVPAIRNPEPAWRVVLAPWRHLFNPAVGALVISRGSHWVRFFALASSVLVLAYTATLLLMWAETVQYDWSRPQSWSASTPASVMFQDLLQIRSLEEVFHVWNRHAVVHALVDVPAIASIIVGMFVCGAALLTAPVAIAPDGLRMAVRRGAQAVAACMGWATLLYVVLAAGFTKIGHMQTLERSFSGWNPDYMMAFVVPFIPISILVLMRRTSLAAAGITPSDDAHLLAPRCEQCGYDLTHRPDHGRCTECGLDMEQSLTRGVRRRPSAWESDAPGFKAWRATTRVSLTQPRRFYSISELHGPMPRVTAFSRATLWFIGVGAVVWFCAAVTGERFLRGSPLIGEEFFVSVIVGAAAAAAGWAVHRGTALLALIWAAMTDSLPEPRTMRRIIAYEASYLWVFCAFNGLFATIVIVLPWRLINELLQKAGPLFQRISGPEVLLVGNGVLILLWLWRYHVVMRAARWANF